MPYHEENNQIVLTLNREEYNLLFFALGVASGYMIQENERIDGILKLVENIKPPKAA